MKILITGASGYVARVVLPYLLEDASIAHVSGLDVRPPGFAHSRFTFIPGDIRSHRLIDAMRGMDALVHMAFIVTEIADKKRIFDINVNGARRVLEAAGEAGIRRIVVASSISAYGAHPRRGGPLTEETPLLGNERSYYARTKRIVEGLLDEFEKTNPTVTVTRLRPSILCGPRIDNFFLDLLRQRVILYPSSNRVGLPLVHEDDVGRAFHLAIKKAIPGAFNIAAGQLSLETIGRILDKRVVRVPGPLLSVLAELGFRIGLSPVSSHWTLLARHPFDVDCEKARTLLGWTPRYSPEEAFAEMVMAWKRK